MSDWSEWEKFRGRGWGRLNSFIRGLKQAANWRKDVDNSGVFPKGDLYPQEYGVTSEGKPVKKIQSAGVPKGSYLEMKLSEGKEDE